MLYHRVVKILHIVPMFYAGIPLIHVNLPWTGILNCPTFLLKAILEIFSINM